MRGEDAAHDPGWLGSSQRASLRLDEHAGLATPEALASFLVDVGIALRYGPTEGVPLASIYAAVRRSVPRAEPEAQAQRRAIAATQALIGDGRAVEVNVVADRLTLVSGALVAPLIALVRRGRSVDELDLSDAARRVLAILGEHPRPTAGFVRARYGVQPKQWPNPADDALAELQRAMVIDRGATDVPEAGAAYLSKDGIPYRLIDVVRAQDVAAADALDEVSAAATVLGAYLRGAVFATRRKLVALFKRCASAGVIDRAVDALVDDRQLERARIATADGVVTR